MGVPTLSQPQAAGRLAELTPDVVSSIARLAARYQAVDNQALLGLRAPTKSEEFGGGSEAKKQLGHEESSYAHEPLSPTRRAADGGSPNTFGSDVSRSRYNY